MEIIKIRYLLKNQLPLSLNSCTIMQIAALCSTSPYLKSKHQALSRWIQFRERAIIPSTERAKWRRLRRFQLPLDGYLRQFSEENQERSSVENIITRCRYVFIKFKVVPYCAGYCAVNFNHLCYQRVFKFKFLNQLQVLRKSKNLQQ